jgi:hypothetical protein
MRSVVDSMSRGGSSVVRMVLSSCVGVLVSG